MFGALAGWAGCGADDREQQPPASGKQSVLRAPGDSGTLDAKACRMLRLGTVGRAVGVPGRELRARANNSLDLTICEWRGGRVRSVKLLVDSAPRAQLRYYNLLSEQHEFHNSDPARKARQIKGVGEDSAYGGAGAWWTRATRQLVAYDRERMVKVRVNVRGFGDHEARSTAVKIATRAVRELRRRA